MIPYFLAALAGASLQYHFPAAASGLLWLAIAARATYLAFRSFAR